MPRVEPLSAHIEQIIESIVLPPYILKRIGRKQAQMGQRFIVRRFLSAVDPAGKAWPKTSPVTKKIFAARHGRKHSGQPGRATGKMLRIIRSRAFTSVLSGKNRVTVKWGRNIKGSTAKKLEWFQARFRNSPKSAVPNVLNPDREVMRFGRKEQQKMRDDRNNKIERYRASLRRKKIPRKTVSRTKIVIGV